MHARHLAAILHGLLCVLRSSAQMPQPGQVWDPVTADEMMQQARLFWQWYDTGIAPAGSQSFSFTHAQDLGHDFQPWCAATAVFGYLYQDQLSNSLTIDQLIFSNPSVLEAFRAYTSTGYLQTDFVNEPLVAIRHLQLLSASSDLPPETAPESWGTVESSLFSQGLLAPIIPPSNPPPNPGIEDLPEIPIDNTNFDRALRDTIRDSRLQDMPYVSDPYFAFQDPGFDCDDFADAMAAWIYKHLNGQYPGTTVSLAWVSWYGNGHVVVRVCYGGSCWYVDAQVYAVLRDPHGDLSFQALLDWLEQLGYYEYGYWYQGWWPTLTIRTPNERPWYEADPWWRNPQRCQQLENATGHDCHDFIMDSAEQ